VEESVKIDRGTIWHVWLPLMAGMFAFGMIFQSRADRHRLASWIGLLLGLVGLGGVMLARYTLGQSFSWVPKAHKLVTCGIYSRIRNPIYVFGMIAVLGMILIVGRPQLLVILAVIIPMQIVRARREARVLEEKFGDEYREYRRRTWF
jgi:protein-S-isoprenylcysteine O-methyltransferase Ste14